MCVCVCVYLVRACARACVRACVYARVEGAVRPRWNVATAMPAESRPRTRTRPARGPGRFVRFARPRLPR